MQADDRALTVISTQSRKVSRLALTSAPDALSRKSRCKALWNEAAVRMTSKRSSRLFSPAAPLQPIPADRPCS